MVGIMLLYKTGYNDGVDFQHKDLPANFALDALKSKAPQERQNHQILLLSVDFLE